MALEEKCKLSLIVLYLSTDVVQHLAEGFVNHSQTYALLLFPAE